MTFPRYPAYKDSGVEWLGVVPMEWETKPFFSIATERSESNFGMIEDNLLSLSYGQIVNKDISSNDGLLPESFGTYQIVHPGDIVFRLTDLQNDKRSLRTAIVKQKGIITSAYLAAKSIGILPDFLNYLLRSYDLSKIFYSMGGGLRQSMKFSDIKRLPILLPTFPEQQSIVAFLDHETARINALVADQELLIGLLKEKRQAVISHAVKQGLDPNVPMKDSGVVWLGMVPDHWEILKVKHAVVIDNGPRCPINRVERAEMSGQYPYWGPTGILDYINHFNYEGERVLIGEDGDHFLKFANWSMTQWATGKFNVNNHAHVLASSEKCLAKWFYFSFMHRDISGDVVVQGVSRLKLTRERLSELFLAVPPLHEQLEIISFMELHVQKVSQAISQIEEQICLLKERHSALISAAVTGQIDVRNWQIFEASA